MRSTAVFGKKSGNGGDLDRRDAGIRTGQGIALIAVVGARSLAERGVAPFGGGCVERGNRCLDSFRIDPGLCREFGQRCAALEVAGCEMMAEWHRKRRHAAKAVFSQ